MKNKLIKSTIILLIGGFLTKVINMIIRIILTRLLGTRGIGTYMLIMPTFSLLIAIAQLGFPVAISKLVAEEKRKNRNLVLSIIPISLFINLLIMIVLIFSSNYIANDLLHEPNTYYGLLSMSLVLPFISISSILRGYFFGKQKMLPHVISNVTEDIIRLLVILIGIPIFILKGINYAIAFVVLSNIISETTSIIVLIFFLPKNFKIEKKDIIPDKSNLKDIFSISIPTTLSRLIGNIGYFFEPIILTYTLLKVGYSNNFIINQYGIVNGYVMPLLLLPSFFTMAISQALIPIISKATANNNIQETKRKIKQAIFLSLLIGIPITLIFIIAPSIPLKLIYNTNEGLQYIKILAPIFLLYYIQTPIASSLQAMGKANMSLQGTIIGITIRTILLFCCSLLKIGIWGLLIAISSNIIVTTIHNLLCIKKVLKRNS